jgi:hypothetical protein
VYQEPPTLTLQVELFVVKAQILMGTLAMRAFSLYAKHPPTLVCDFPCEPLLAEVLTEVPADVLVAAKAGTANPIIRTTTIRRERNFFIVNQPFRFLCLCYRSIFIMIVRKNKTLAEARVGVTQYC